jgi:4-amino-4-deoxy-L-arabinose transferase-like glycosyltransferase
MPQPHYVPSLSGVSKPASWPHATRSAELPDARRTALYLCAVIFFAFVVRLLLLDAYPLTDNTEARYAEIARKMVETGQWLVPQIDYGVPFWAKPPLSMWLTAMSYEVLGVSAFAARLPSLLLGVAICALAWRLAVRRGGALFALRATTVVATSALMLVSAGAVMTDPAMVLGTTLSMAGFWLAVSEHDRRWGYLFFVGIAIGLLAKGPVATVLTLLPIGAWTMLTGRYADCLRRLPWIGGTLLTLALVVPWYVAAELQSPGFLRYFIVGEHWERFLVPGWKGDLYGAGHAFPRGAIWLFALASTLPWSPWLVWQAVRRGALRRVATPSSGDGWLLYLVCWTLAPLVFFTLSRNILPTYVLPGLVGFGLLVAEVWHGDSSGTRVERLGLVMPVFLVAALIVGSRAGFQSQREIVSAWQRSTAGTTPLVYYPQRPLSAAFYSQGKAKRVDDAAALRHELERTPTMYVATDVKALMQMPGDLRERIHEVARSPTGKYVLLRGTLASTSTVAGASGSEPAGEKTAAD